MKFTKGTIANPEGRPRGRLNKINRELREMILQALSDAGGVEYLTEQARKEPAAFLALLGRLLPKDVKVEQTGRAYIVAPEQAASMDEWAAMAQPTPDEKVH